MISWDSTKCIQCTFCSLVCPHAAVRVVAMTEEEEAKAPEGMTTIPMMGMPEYKFGVVVSALDCTGCGSCGYNSRRITLQNGIIFK